MLPKQDWEPLCFSYSSLKALHHELVLPRRRDTQKLKKNILEVVFASEKFDKYIFGCDIVDAKTDHKLLESIFKKCLCHAPARLQRMLLRLQRYNFDISYKKV